MIKKPISLDIAIQETRKRFNQIPPSLRPKKNKRPAGRRSEEEATALARSVYYSVKKAEEEGYIQKNSGGYRMLWTAVQK
ncbi:hypothetical protein [Sporomusa termitida]|uniref:Uncharacterized protein n=1 Tax=Sporomusa termitida TaxID=2377 RepID=A0A517DNT3_9FIRM|nr:hypothetical protein [Sporomusa termitida]QDR78916.1 hypothetical protein SPTER_01670 [Sporomusa termitida]